MGGISARCQLRRRPRLSNRRRTGNRPCEPKDFVDYLLRNELTHFEGSPSTRVRQEARQQKLIHRLELLQARYEGNRLLY